MKFLVTVTPRQVPMPPGMIADLLEAQGSWLQERVADGTIECLYGLVGGGGFGVANVDSHEEMHALLVSSPAAILVDYDARAIGDSSAMLAEGVAALRRVAAAMPG